MPFGGTSVTVQTGYGTGTVTTETGPDGNLKQTTERADGSRTVRFDAADGSSTTTEYDANGRATASETRMADGSRARTGFDARGNPVKTEVRESGSPGRLIQETTYWPRTGVPRTTRTWLDRELDEVIYYDEQGRETRRAREPGAGARLGWEQRTRWVFDGGSDGPVHREEAIPGSDEDASEGPGRAGPPVQVPNLPSRPQHPSY